MLLRENSLQLLLVLSALPFSRFAFRALEATPKAAGEDGVADAWGGRGGEVVLECFLGFWLYDALCVFFFLGVGGCGFRFVCFWG